MNLQRLGTPRKKSIAMAISGLLKNPGMFTSKKALHELRTYRQGENGLIDIALWNVFNSVENKQGIREAMTILERTLSGEINTMDGLKTAISPESTRRAEKKKREIDQQGAEALKDLVAEAGVISLYDLMTRCHTRDIKKITARLKEGRIRLVKMPNLARALIKRRKKDLLSEIEMLLGMKDILKVQMVAMSPEYHKRVLEELDKI